MAQVKWTSQALDDLEAICLFIARDAPQAAAIFADRAFRATDHLAKYPCSGRVVPEFGSEDIREVIVGNYRVIYRIKQNAVQVATVHHGARLLDSEKIEG